MLRCIMAKNKMKTLDTGMSYFEAKLEYKSGVLYEEFRAYCLHTGEYQRTNADFVLELEKRGFTRKKKKFGMWVQGLQVKDTDFAD